MRLRLLKKLTALRNRIGQSVCFSDTCRVRRLKVTVFNLLKRQGTACESDSDMAAGSV